MNPLFFGPCLTGALVLGAAAAGAQELIPTPTPPERRMPAVSLLPEGSTLSGVMIPRYDNQLRLASVLRAKTMLILDSSTVEGEDVSVELYRPDGTRTGRIEFGQATYKQQLGVLVAKQRVNVISDDLSAQGTGAVVHLNATRGFLLGPVQSRIHDPSGKKQKKKTSMITPPATRLRARLGPTAALLAILPLPLVAAPTGLTDRELTAIDQAAAPANADAAKRGAAARALTAAADASSAIATETLTSFLKIAGLATVLAESTKARNTETPKHRNTDPPAKPSPEDTVITCDGGMFFDGEIGVIVYLENIRLHNPQFNLSCSDQLKIFLEKRPEKPKPKSGGIQKNEKKSPPPSEPSGARQTARKGSPEGTAGGPDQTPASETPASAPGLPADGLFGGSRFGDVRQIVATGGVIIRQKNAKGAPVVAMAETAIFDGKTGDIILRGGKPKLQQGRSAIRALEPGLYIRIYQNGDIYNKPGRWETIAADLNNQPGMKKKNR